MTKLHAHFDGRVLVPDEPVDLPQGCTLEVQVWEAAPQSEKERVAENRLPTFPVEPGAEIIRTEDVLAAEDEW